MVSGAHGARGPWCPGPMMSGAHGARGPWCPGPMVPGAHGDGSYNKTYFTFPVVGILRMWTFDVDYGVVRDFGARISLPLTLHYQNYTGCK